MCHKETHKEIIKGNKETTKKANLNKNGRKKQKGNLKKNNTYWYNTHIYNVTRNICIKKYQFHTSSLSIGF